MLNEPIDPSSRLRRLSEDDSFLPSARQVEVDELLVRFPRLPGAPPALYGGVIRVRVYDDHELTESHLSPLEREAGLCLVESPEAMCRALQERARHLRETLE